MKNNNVAVIIVMLAGLVLGGVIANAVSNVPYLSWLAYGQYFGTDNPLVLNLGVLVFTLGLQIHITIAGILGMAVALFIYLQMSKMS